MRELSAGHLRVLEALARFRLMSVKQMQAAGVGKDAKHLRQLVHELHRFKLVHQLPDTNRDGERAVARFTPGVGIRPLLHYLTPRGAQEAADMLGIEPPLVRTKPYTFSAKVAEWEAIVETHIALCAWAAAIGGQLDWFKADFAPGASQLNRATSLPYQDRRTDPPKPKSFTPDGLARLLTALDTPHLVVVEVYVGGWRHSLQHFREKLPDVRAAAEQTVPEQAFGFDKLGRAARYMILFSTAAMREGALKGWPDSAAPIWGRFFVKSLDELAGSFNAGWHQPGRACRPLFKDFPA